MAIAIGLVALAVRVPWGAAEPMDHLEYVLVVETQLAKGWPEILVNRVGIEQAHQPLSRVPIALARSVGLRPEAVRWVQLAAWMLALAAAARLLPRWLGPRPGEEPAAGADAACVAAFAWLALSPLACRYGFDVTPYGLLAFFSWASLAALYRVLDGSGRAPFVAGLLAGAGFYAHYVELWFFPAGLTLVALDARALEPRSRRQAWLGLAIAAAIFGLCVVPWLPAMRWGLTLFDRYVGRESELYAMDFSAVAQLREVARIATGWPGWLGLGLAVVPLTLAWTIGDRPRAAHATWLMAALSPYLVFRGFQQLQYESAAHGTYFGARHFMPFVLFLIVGVVAAVEALAARLPAALRSARYGAFLLLVLVAGASTVRDRFVPSRPDIRGAAEVIRAGLRDGDAVGVLPRFFYSPLVMDAVSHGLYTAPDATGFARIPMKPGDDAGPLVWLPADDREFPLPAALENFAFERLWLVDFRESEFGLLELSPRVSERTAAHLDARHELLERRQFPQLTLSLYRLRHELERWEDPPWILDEAHWKDHPRSVSWGTEGTELVYRIDLPVSSRDRDAELDLEWPAPEIRNESTPVRVSLGTIDDSWTLGPAAERRSIRFAAPAGIASVLRLRYPAGHERVPSRVELHDASAP